MKFRFLLILGTVCAAWLLQAWTWFEQPSKQGQSALVTAVAAKVQAGDELAYLPGWEQHWALSLTQHLPDHSQRLGVDDLLRPFRRLWLFESADSPGIGFASDPSVKVLEEQVQGGLRVRLFEHSRTIKPIAYPGLKKCRLSKTKKRCSDASGRVQSTEITFDGRFARGQKIVVKSDAMTLNFQGKPGATLVGGMGWTGHGLRHAKGRASARWQGVSVVEHDLESRAGLKPFKVVSNAQGKVELKLALQGWNDAEFGLSSGWVQ